MEAIVTSALLVLLSVSIRSFIIQKDSPIAILAKIGLGLPIDSTFVLFSIAISSLPFQDYWANNRAMLITGILIIGVFQLGLLYKPARDFIEMDRPWLAFFLWFANTVISFVVIYIFLIKIVK